MDFVTGTKTYSVTYVAVGFMSNLYCVDTFTFKASRKEIKLVE